MGLLERFTKPLRVTEAVNAGRSWMPPIESPNGGTSSMTSVVWSEFFAGEVAEVTRQGALMVPAIKRGRDILVGAIAGAPLVQLRGEEDVTPDWLRNSTTTGVSPWHRMAATIDDLVFFDWSLWLVQRDGSGQIVDALRVPFERWEVDDTTGRITIDQKTASAEEVILIPGNGSGGILMAGAQTIKGYRAMERAWIGRVQNPIPLVELHQTSDDPLTDGDDDAEDDEIQRLIDEWAAARISPTGAVGYTPQQIELRVHGDVKHELFVEGRNAAVLDVARLLAMPAALLDGSMSTASLTYSTVEGRRSEFDMYTLPTWTAPIEAALSLDSVAPAGEVIRFDWSARNALQAPATNPPRED